MILFFLICLTGFILLYFSADWLVKGSSDLARSLGITPVVIGLTVVAFGTSAPEMVVSLISSVKGKSMIAVGNVIGSNICNIALVLGAAAIFNPITSHQSVVKRDIPIMLGISILLLILSINSRISRLEGIILFLGVIAYTWLNYFFSRKDISNAKNKTDVKNFENDSTGLMHRHKQIFYIIAGIAGVIIGAEIVIEYAVRIMKILGVSEKFIGLTIVAFGTSLPELATSVVAAIRKEMDISIGNLVGSNVFNILSVLGVAAMAKPIQIPGGFYESGLWIDYIVMVLVSIITWLMMRKDYTIDWKNGLVLLLSYLIYLSYLVVKA